MKRVACLLTVGAVSVLLSACSGQGSAKSDASTGEKEKPDAPKTSAAKEPGKSAGISPAAREQLVAMYAQMGPKELFKFGMENLWQTTPAPDYVFQGDDLQVCSRVLLAGAWSDKKYSGDEGDHPFFGKIRDRLLRAQNNEGKFTSSSGKDITFYVARALKTIDVNDKKKWNVSTHAEKVTLASNWLKAHPEAVFQRVPAEEFKSIVAKADLSTMEGMEKLFSVANTINEMTMYDKTPGLSFPKKEILQKLCEVRNEDRSFGPETLKKDSLYQATALLILSILINMDAK
jgi:hypothetical protein